MLNIISFLLIVVSSLICIKSTDMPNQLLNLGILILAGYSFSLVAGKLKLPDVTGYVIAGILLGSNGLGFFDPSFSGDMTLIEGVFFMMLVSELLRSTTPGEEGRRVLKRIWYSALPVVVTAFVTFALLSFRDIPLPVRVLFSLFAASFSPAMFAALERDVRRREAYRELTIGAFVSAFILFSVFAAYFGPRSSAWWKLALAPL
ncbi:cation:proton antiporter, partial [Candidatus Latescibacterota bacterium]